MSKWKVKLINGQYVVGRDEKTSFGGMNFILPMYGTKFYKSKKMAQKRADKLNESSRMIQNNK